jgi:hypothetical protein
MPVIAIDAPVGGLNGYDSADSMPPTDALILRNWIPRAGYLQSRQGHVHFTANLGGPVETLVTHFANGVETLVAAANKTLWEISSVGANTSLGGPYTNDRWQHVMINGKLILVNGEDPELAFDGTILTPLDYTGSEPVITAGEFIGVCVFKGRAFYWKALGTKFWYAQAGAYQGDLNEFDIGSLIGLGGDIVLIQPWTIDPGTGPDDLLVIVTSRGELVLYQGDDPGALGYFEQVGRFEIPPPLSIRGWLRFGADLIIMTRAGYVNLATVIAQGATSDYPAFSRKLGRFVYEAGTNYQNNYGHEAIQADSSLLLFNVPIGDGKAEQFAHNPTTQAWSQFTNIPAVTFTRYGGDIYIGQLTGYVDHLFGFNDLGAPIPLDALPAYNVLGDPGSQKQLVAAQVLSTHPDPRKISLNGWGDYTVPDLPNQTLPPGPSEGTLWNVGQWNAVYWQRTGLNLAKTTKGWKNIHAFGFAVTCSVQMRVANQEVIWRQTGLRYREAGAQ